MPRGDHCCVPQCTSDRRKKKESLVLYHTLPKDGLLAKKWIDAIRLDVGPKRDSCVCSQHFTDDQYCQGRKAKGARLKKDAVPHVFAWMEDDEDSDLPKLETVMPSFVAEAVRTEKKRTIGVKRGTDGEGNSSESKRGAYEKIHILL